MEKQTFSIPNISCGHCVMFIKNDCVISNHTEMDHSGGLPRVMHKIGEDKPLYCSKMGQQ